MVSLYKATASVPSNCPLQVAGLVEEKNALFLSLEKEKSNLQDAEERNQKLAALKADLDKQLAEVQVHTEVVPR